MIVLDTDIFTHLQHGRADLVERVMGQQEDLAITLVTRIEVLQGRFASILKADSGEKLRIASSHLESLEAKLRDFTVLPVSDPAAKHFDRFKSERRLRRIGRADLLIACITLAENGTLITRNLRHFQLVPGLRVENWMD